VAGEPEETPTKEAVYQLRGEAVSVGGAVEWRIHQLAQLFAGSADVDTSRQWKDLRRHLSLRSLTDALQVEMSAVAAYYTARNAAVHSYVIVIPGPTKVLRLNRRRTPDVAQASLDQLRGEVTVARRAWEAVGVIGRALYDGDRAALAHWGSLRRALQIDRV
jgi:hypothetical protein